MAEPEVGPACHHVVLLEDYVRLSGADLWLGCPGSWGLMGATGARGKALCFTKHTRGRDTCACCGALARSSLVRSRARARPHTRRDKSGWAPMALVVVGGIFALSGLGAIIFCSRRAPSKDLDEILVDSTVTRLDTSARACRLPCRKSLHLLATLI